MSDHIARLLQRHRRGTVLVDTNLLLLYFVGLLNPLEIPRFKRTRQYVTEDYDTLSRFLRRFETVATTPNILTEVSNLAGQLPEHLRADYFELFARGIALLEETCCPSSEVSEREEMRRFGLTDAGIVHLADEKLLVVTDDFALSGYLASQGVDVLNFNHIRVINW